MAFIFIFLFLSVHLLPQLLGSEAFQKSSSSLLAVQIIFRHGDRTPRSSLATGSEAPLTSKGKKELLELGQYIRKRYKSFLGSNSIYAAAKSVDLISSEKDRNIQSAQLFAFGLFENLQKNPLWNGGKLEYNPIPIRSIPADIDRYLLPTEPCPRSNQFFVESTLASFDRLNEENPGLFETFVDLSPNLIISPELPTLKVLIVDTLLRVAEEIKYNVSQNFPLSELGETMRKFPIMENLSHFNHLFYFNNTEKLKLSSGPLLQTLLENFHDEVNPKKLRAFSGHDRTLYGQLMILGVVPKKDPATGSALIHELHRSSTGKNEKFVKIFFKDGMGSDLEEIISTCGQYFCDLNVFTESLKKYIPIDFHEECRAT